MKHKFNYVIKEACQYILISLICCCSFICPAVGQTPDDLWPPWVTKTTTNSATINWRGEQNGLGQIDYATTSYYLQNQTFEGTIASQTMSNYQHVQLTGLEPGTSYTYRVRPSGNENAFGIRTFRTMPVSGPFTFIVISDSQEGHHYDETQRFKYVAESIANEPDVLFILHGGDNARFDYEPRWATFFQVADVMLAKFAIFPVIGNHEYHNYNNSSGPPTDADNFHSAYDMPLNYSFDCAGVRFIILNTPDPANAVEDDPQTSLALAQSQESWLKDQLDNNLSGTFTMHHHPIWDNGRTTMSANLEPWEILYHSYPISANFAGHTHNYQRYLVGNIPYFIVGNAGGPFSDLSNIHPDDYYQHGQTRQLGYLKVAVDPANNTATAQEIFVASVEVNDSSETPSVYSPPLVEETVTFQLKPSDTSSDNDNDNNFCFISTIMPNSD